jgi:hypothetical protein
MEEEETKEKSHGGWRPGAGRKKKEQLFNELSMPKKRKLIMTYITDEDVRQIVGNMVKMAKTDKDAAKYLIDQFIGKPLQATDITSGGEKLESFNDDQVSRIARRITSGPTNDGIPSGTKTLN